jgi:hypothetical protein
MGGDRHGVFLEPMLQTGIFLDRLVSVARGLMSVKPERQRHCTLLDDSENEARPSASLGDVNAALATLIDSEVARAR